ncbi:MAG: exonuclease domain-containing protein [Oscillospiraceae bacterium]
MKKEREIVWLIIAILLVCVALAVIFYTRHMRSKNEGNNSEKHEPYRPVQATTYEKITDEADEDSCDLSGLIFTKYKPTSKKALSSFQNYIVLDCETTGLSPKTDEIIEIAMAKYIDGELSDEFQCFVRPTVPLPPMITRLTGITQKDLETAPYISDIIDDIWLFLAGFTLVAHNASFDIGFLRTAFAMSEFEGEFEYLDTLYLARKAYPDLKNHKLETLIVELGISELQTHRAMDDVLCTQKILEKSLEVLLEKKEEELSERRRKKALTK